VLHRSTAHLAPPLRKMVAGHREAGIGEITDGERLRSD
jgi:hypothetical protein